MSFTFLHAADIHLDSPLCGLALSDDPRAEVFRSASRRAFRNLVDAAIDRRVDFLVIAGDLFDGAWKDLNSGLFFAQTMGELGRAGVRVFVVRGNHDAETLADRRIGLPDNVTVFPAREPGTVEVERLRVAVHGQSFGRADVTENLALGYPAAKPGWFNLGILHTACDGREGHMPYAPCSVDQLVRHGYDYWALGHVHGREVLHEHPHVVFPGNLQGRHIREPGAKGATLVEVADGRVVAVEHLPLDVARWQAVEVDLSGVEERTEVAEQVRESLSAAADAAEDRPLAARLTLRGATSLHAELLADPAGLRLQAASAALAVDDRIWLEKIVVATADPDEADTALRSDTLGALLRLASEARRDEDLRAVLRRELRGLMARVPKADATAAGLPDETDLEAILARAGALLAGRLLTAERA